MIRLCVIIVLYSGHPTCQRRKWNIVIPLWEVVCAVHGPFEGTHFRLLHARSSSCSRSVSRGAKPQGHRTLTSSWGGVGARGSWSAAALGNYELNKWTATGSGLCSCLYVLICEMGCLSAVNWKRKRPEARAAGGRRQT